MKYAKVNIESNTKALDRLFTYQIPVSLEDKLCIGSKVSVPFRNYIKNGYIIDITTHSDYEKVKEIIDYDEKLSLLDWQIYLAQWLKNRYFCTLSNALSIITHPNFSGDTKLNRVFSINPKIDYEKVILELPKRQKVLNRILNKIRLYGIVSEDVLKKECGGTKKHIETLIQNNILIYSNEYDFKNPNIMSWDGFSSIKLNYDQNKVYNEIFYYLENPKAKNFLLHGVTGSGKTEVYIKLVEKTLKMDRQAIILVPEISLTPQLLGKFYEVFGDQIAVFHSKLSKGERYDQWIQVKLGHKKIVIGARSALFSPCHKLGLIIVDEAHDDAYKSETDPKYNAVDVAFYIGGLKNIPVLLGTATPSISMLKWVNENKLKYLSMKRRYNNTPLPNIEVVDMRNEVIKGNNSIFSVRLQNSIGEVLKKGQQVILFLNRKGYSNFIKCKNCGYVLKCPNCDISLTYYKKDSKAKCNYCGYFVVPNKICSECSTQGFDKIGIGTEQVEEILSELFPNYVAKRLDGTVASKKGETEKLLREFKNGKISILIGTRMVSKGLDFSNVSLVGVLLADELLNFPDYRASESAYQTLTQVSGRAGRGDITGKVIVQTYSPNDFVIEAIKNNDFNFFIGEEKLIRKTFEYPPYIRLANIIVYGFNETDVEISANRLYNNILNVVKANKINVVKILEPNPALYSKINNRYRWQIIIKYRSEEFKTIRKLLYFLCIEKYKQLNLLNVKLSVDIDAMSLL